MLSAKLKDFTIEVISVQHAVFKSEIQVKYIKAIVNQLLDRLPHVEQLGAFSIFDPQKLPCDEEELTTYGQDKVKIFSTTYSEGLDPVIDAEEFTSEWEGFKRLIKNNYTSKTMCQEFVY